VSVQTENSFAQLIHLWPHPIFPQAGSAIAIADATESLRLLPSDSIPLVLTSPPYNIGMPFEEQLSTGEYVDWATEWLSELARVTAPDGSVWLNLGFCEVPGRGKAVPITYWS
jgi:adenine-specific DNA-methyltransferase